MQTTCCAEIRDEALFKDPPAKEDCPICLLPMPMTIISCASLPAATISSVSIYDFAIANEELANEDTEEDYPCCGKSICAGCVHSFRKSGNIGKCSFCNADRGSKTDEEIVEEVMKRVEANDANSICMLANSYHHGVNGLQRDEERAIELYARAADLGHSGSHYQLGVIYHEGGEKAKFHYEAAAMAGHEVARNTLGYIEFHSGNMERALKHTMIAASRGNYFAMHSVIISFEEGGVSRESIDSTLTAYNNSCAEMRSEERDIYILTRVRTRPM